MIYTKDEEIPELVKKFEECRVTRAERNHAAHLTVALWYALYHDFDAAVAKMRGGIFDLLSSFDVDFASEMPYHETLTVFWMQTVFGFLKKSKDKNSLVKLTNDLIETCGDSGLPLKFYSRALLFSAEARAKYLEPNLKTDAQISQ